MSHAHRTARRNPRAPAAPKHPTVVLVRRFDPTGEELARWEVLVRDEDGRPDFLSPSAAMEAALNPSDNADLRVGDIVATVPAEAISKIEDNALGLYVRGLHGMKKAPDMPGGVGRRWLSVWGKDARAMLTASIMVERKRLVMAACDCAETVLHLVPVGDTRSRAALDAARAWCQGKATLSDVLRASTAIRKLDDFPATWSAALASSVALAENRNSAVSKATGAESSAESAARDAGVSFDQTNAANANLVERWIPLPVALLSSLGQADVFRLDPQEGLPANLRENPRRPSRRGPAYAAPRRNPAVEPARAYSPGTSIKQIPALHKALAGAGVLRPGSVNADIGGGRFDDATLFLADHGVTSLVYDPGNRSEAWNRRVLEQVEDGRADSATIANVLNVIPDPGVRAAVLRLAANVARPGGPVFVGVYEGDGKGNGRETSKGWQENRKLASYLPEVLAVFPDASIRTLGGLRMIVANDGGAVARAPHKAPRRASRGAHRAAARSNPRGHRRPGRGRANPFSPADVALLGANVAAVGGIAYSFALDKKSKVLDRAVLRETDRASILRDTHLDRGPDGRKYVSSPDLKALADPHIYTRAWDARKRELLEQLRTGDYEIRRTGEHQWYFTRPGEARGGHGPATVHGANGLPSGAQYPGLPAPSVYTDTLHGAHGAREHAAVRSNPRATSGSRFDALVQEFERRGVRSPRGLAASIGRRKYGTKRFAAMGAAGRAHRRAKARGKQGK